MAGRANLVGRAGFVGDDLGSSVIASRLVHDLMHLCFLLDKQYEPYAKWFGTAFSRLECGPALAPILRAVQRADRWTDRQDALAAAYRFVADRHNALGNHRPVEITDHRMWNRPFAVPWGNVPEVLRPLITDPSVEGIADQYPTGEMDRVCETVWSPRSRRDLLRLFD